MSEGFREKARSAWWRIARSRAGRALADSRWRLRRRRSLAAVRARIVEGGVQEHLRWAIKTSVPADASGDQWGDLFFAQDLARALEAMGQEAFVDRRDERLRPDSRPDDVVLNLRGAEAVPHQRDALNVLWVISHPEWVGDLELTRGADLVFSAGTRWAEAAAKRARRPIEVLLQATDAHRFHPGAADPRWAADVLFVGKSHRIGRPIVRDAIAAGASLTVYGDEWDGIIEPSYVKARYLPNEELPAAYRSARIVLNDHWSDMREHGLLSNRLFDAAATGARIVSDDVGDLTETFHGLVRAYRSPEELKAILGDDRIWPSPAARVEIAARIAAEHSFDARADVLLRAARSALGLDRRKGLRRRP